MKNLMNKREFLAASVGIGLASGGARAALAQQESGAPARTGSGPHAGDRRPQSRMAKTTKLFKSPEGFPNGIAVAPEGLWIAEQSSPARRPSRTTCPNRKICPKAPGSSIGMASC